MAGATVLLLLLLLALIARKAGGRSRRRRRERICPNPVCRQPWLPEWTACLFCGALPTPCLAFRSGPLAGQTFPLGGEVTTLGSIAGNSIVLADPAVSRKHCGIRRDGEGWQVADLGSLNGVFLNGERIARHRLREGDVVRVGQSEAVFELG